MKKTVFTKDGVEVEKGTNKYKGHIFYDEDGGKYKCLGYFPKLDDCVYENLQTGKEVVGCMDGFYFKDPKKFAKGSTIKGNSAFTFQGLDKRFQKLDWRDTTEAYYGLDFTPFMSVVEEYIEQSGKSSQGLNSHFEKLDWRDTTEAYYGLDFTPFMSEIENYATSKFAKGTTISVGRALKGGFKFHNLSSGDKVIYGKKELVISVVGQDFLYGVDKFGKQYKITSIKDIKPSEELSKKLMKNGGGFKLGDKVKVVRGANKGEKGVVSNTDSDFFGDYTIDVRGHKLWGFKADDLIKYAKGSTVKGGGVGKFKVGDKVIIEYINDGNEHNGEIGTITYLNEYNYYPKGDKSVVERKTQGEITYHNGEVEEVSDFYREGSGLVSPIQKVILRKAKEYVNTDLIKKEWQEKNKYAKGSTIKGNSNYRKFGAENSRLAKFNIDDLDDFESMQYNQFSKSMDKASALQILINNVEGDYSQLNEQLSEIAEEQFPSVEFFEDNRQYKKGGAIKGFCYTIGGL
ncbi:MAG: hypothetical protein WCI04_00190 [archaeon]